MSKLVFDSDGLIKLFKSGCLQIIFQNFACSISREVHEETVIKGMERLYDDAFEIEGLIKKDKLTVEVVRNNKQAQNILKHSSAGKGEAASLHLFFNLDATAIISDDRVFLNLLHKNNVPFITPTDLIVRLYVLKLISKKEALDVLNKIKPYASKDSYANAKANLEV
ncbi:MAG: hypothetical protein Q8P40_14090 [Nitrospirota bacterium]|nr:hypothetical protein [Nitrospirota bacterium]